jgi:hypothetical protein
MHYDALDFADIKDGGDESGEDAFGQRDSWVYENLESTAQPPPSGRDAESEESIPNFPSIRLSQRKLSSQLVWRKSADLQLQRILGDEAEEEKVEDLQAHERATNEEVLALSGQSAASSSTSPAMQACRPSREEARRTELYGIKETRLVRLAQAANVPETELDEAENAENTKHALIELILQYENKAKVASSNGRRHSYEVSVSRGGSDGTLVLESAFDAEASKPPEQAIWENAWSLQPQYESASSDGSTSSRDSLKDEWGWQAPAPNPECEDSAGEDKDRRDVAAARTTRRSLRRLSRAPGNLWQFFTGHVYELCCSGESRVRRVPRGTQQASEVRLESPPAIPEEVLRIAASTQAEHHE